MRRTTLLFSIFIFLSAAFSLRGQNLDSLYAASLCEKAVFEAQTPRQANQALLEKARILHGQQLYRQEMEALGRLRMYALRPEQRGEVLERQALCAFLSEDYDAALSLFEEAGIETGYVQPKLKSEWAAMFLTFLVPAGYIYVEKPLEGLLSTSLNALSVLWIVSQISSGCYVSGILGGAIALNGTYLGAQKRVAQLLYQRNAEIIRESKKACLIHLLDPHLKRSDAEH